MSKELDMLAKDFSKTPVTVLRAQINLYQTSIQSAAASFLRKVEQECKKNRRATVTLIAVIE